MCHCCFGLKNPLDEVLVAFIQMLVLSDSTSKNMESWNDLKIW